VITARRRLRGLAGIVAGLAVVAALAGCTSNDALAEDYKDGGNPGYVSGDGSVTEFAAAERSEPVEFESELSDGTPVSSADYKGQVLVVNFWYAACPPCRVEAPDLQQVSADFEGKGATFLGVNVRDQAATADTFNDEFGITYPTVIDTNERNMVLAFAGNVQPNAVPTTLVLDKDGRVAARFLGLVKEASILETVIADTLAEAD